MWIEYLPHTADIRMKIRGKTLEALFCNGIKGMGNILKEGFCVGQQAFDLSLTIEVSSTDTTCLLIDLLSEVLSVTYIENAIFCNADFLRMDADRTSVELYGNYVESFDEEIKAVTYHEADVYKKDGLWESMVVFDI